jgi:TolA-binding protein
MGPSIRIDFQENSQPAKLKFKLTCESKLKPKEELMQDYRVYKGAVRIKEGIREVPVSVWKERDILIVTLFEKTEYPFASKIYPIEGQYIESIALRHFITDTRVDIKLTKPIPTAIDFEDNEIILALVEKEAILTVLLEDLDKEIARERELLEKKRERKILEAQLENALANKQYTRAVSILERLNSLYPEDEKIKNKLKEIKKLMGEGEVIVPEEKKEEVDSFYKKVEELVKEKKYDDAMSILQDMLKKFPQEKKKIKELIDKFLKEKQRLEMNKYYQIVKAYEQSEEFAKAISTLEQMLKIYPDEEKAIKEEIKRIEKKREFLGLFKEAGKKEKEGKLEEALKIYQQIVKDYPLIETKEVNECITRVKAKLEEEEINSTYQRVKELVTQEKYDEALNKLKELIKKYPQEEKKASSIIKDIESTRQKLEEKQEKERLYAQAENLIKEEAYSKAISILEEIAKKYPKEKENVDTLIAKIKEKEKKEEVKEEKPKEIIIPKEEEVKEEEIKEEEVKKEEVKKEEKEKEEEVEKKEEKKEEVKGKVVEEEVAKVEEEKPKEIPPKKEEKKEEKPKELKKLPEKAEKEKKEEGPTKYHRGTDYYKDIIEAIERK